MSFVTRCPACATHFRVVADQLKIADGWVRCGQCGEVFDAAAQLDSAGQLPPQASPPPPVAASAMAAVPSSPSPAAASEPVDEPLAEAQSDARTDEAPGVASERLEPSEWWPEPGPVPAMSPGDDERTELPAELPVDLAADPVLNARGTDTLAEPSEFPSEVPSPVDRYEVPPASEWQPSPADVPQADAGLADAADLDAVPEQVGFVRQAQRRAWWRRPMVRASLLVVSACLLLVLAAQWAVHERDRIAALRPDLRPVLERLCQPVGCRVQALRWADALSIESTTLARRGNGRYLLEVVVRNASLYALAMPALELSLTDVQDKLLLRRVIAPEELPAAPATVGAHETLTLRIDVQLEPAVSEGLSGYRTLLFYP